MSETVSKPDHVEAAAPTSSEVAAETLAGVNLITGELPTNIAPGVSKWMTWSFVVLIFSVPLVQSVLEIRNGMKPQALRVFRRTPSKDNLKAFEKKLEEDSFAKQFVQPRILAAVNGPKQHSPDAVKLVQATTDGARTPFIQWLDNTGGSLMLHPFIDFTNAHGPPPDQLDYFGFRNPANMYFERPPGRLVVLCGNSEIMGSTHSRPVAARLEEYLTKHSGEKWHVLNLGMNGYTVSAEINAFVHLAHHLNPDVVISHSAGSDLYFALMVPMEYKQIGMYYYKDVEKWYPRVRGLTIQGAGEWKPVAGGEDLIADGYLRNVKKFRDIVERDGTRFILGLQKCDPDACGPNYTADQRKDWRQVLELYKEVQGKLGSQQLDHIDFAKVADIKCVDPIHTNDSSAQIIAETYGKHILRRDFIRKDPASPFKTVSFPK